MFIRPSRINFASSSRQVIYANDDLLTNIENLEAHMSVQHAGNRPSPLASEMRGVNLINS